MEADQKPEDAAGRVIYLIERQCHRNRAAYTRLCKAHIAFNDPA